MRFSTWRSRTRVSPIPKSLRWPNTKNALLLTADKDFGELVFRQKRIHAGVVLIRLAGLSAEIKADAVSAAFREHSDGMSKAFTVNSPGFIRIRKAAWIV